MSQVVGKVFIYVTAILSWHNYYTDRRTDVLAALWILDSAIFRCYIKAYDIYWLINHVIACCHGDLNLSQSDVPMFEYKYLINLSGKAFNTRNNYVVRIWFHIKQQIMKELNKDIVCIFKIIYVILYIIYIAATCNKVV